MATVITATTNDPQGSHHHTVCEGCAPNLFIQTVLAQMLAHSAAALHSWRLLMLAATHMLHLNLRVIPICHSLP